MGGPRKRPTPAATSRRMSPSSAAPQARSRCSCDRTFPPPQREPCCERRIELSDQRGGAASWASAGRQNERLFPQPPCVTAELLLAPVEVLCFPGARKCLCK